MSAVYTYPSPTTAAAKAVGRRHPDELPNMPPVLVTFLSNCYSGGGYPIRLEGKTWIIDTTLQHIELEIMSPRRAQLMAWARSSGPAYEKPAVDRTIACAED